MAPQRRGERDEGHGLVAIGQGRRVLVHIQLPEGLGGKHMMIGVTRQIVMHGVGDGSVAIPTVMRPDWRIFHAHQPIMLHVVDELVECAPDHAGEEDDEHALPPAEDPGERQDRQRHEMSEDHFVPPGIWGQAFAPKARRLEACGLTKLLRQRARHEGAQAFAASRRGGVVISADLTMMRVDVVDHEGRVAGEAEQEIGRQFGKPVVAMG